MEKVYKTATPWLLEVLMKTDFSGDTLDILSTLGDTGLEAPTRVFSVEGRYDHIHQVLAPLGVHCHMLTIQENPDPIHTPPTHPPQNPSATPPKHGNTNLRTSTTHGLATTYLGVVWLLGVDFVWRL